MVICEHEGKEENASRRRVFSTFLECSQMTGVFYHGGTRKAIKHAFSVLYADKTWVFDQSEPGKGPIYIIKTQTKYHSVFTKIIRRTISFCKER